MGEKSLPKPNPLTIEPSAFKNYTLKECEAALRYAKQRLNFHKNASMRTYQDYKDALINIEYTKKIIEILERRINEKQKSNNN